MDKAYAWPLHVLNFDIACKYYVMWEKRFLYQY